MSWWRRLSRLLHSTQWTAPQAAAASTSLRTPPLTKRAGGVAADTPPAIT